MFNTLKMKFFHGKQYIPNIRKASIDSRHRGFPIFSQEKCAPSCSECEICCPTNAINPKNAEIDLGQCVFCGDCERACSRHAIKFSNFYKTTTTERNSLLVRRNMSETDFYKQAIASRSQIRPFLAGHLSSGRFPPAAAMGVSWS